ncbi:MAG TPA: GNAT family N-acetyltransferase [Planctomycetota bacterium]|nr:GNAT family N-acetyltransferase [Planctomycetota bacterium]
MSAAPFTLRAATLDELGPREVWELYRLRARVFVVEQQCFYLDPDDADGHDQTRHVLARSASGTLAGYLRVLPPGLDAHEPVIGRVVCAPEVRGQGLGHRLVQSALALVADLWPGTAVRLHAQTYLEAFYQSHGFDPVGESYLLDGIPHLEMLRPKPRA